MLVVGVLTRPVAVALAGNMLGAIVTAGRIDGGPVHLGLAPALLVAMLVLLKTGAGARSIDARASRWFAGPRTRLPEHLTSRAYSPEGGSEIVPSAFSGKPGLCATSHGCPSGSMKIPE